MGVDYSVVLGIGKQFRHKSEAVNFLQENLLLTEDEYEDMDNDLGGFIHKSIEVSCVDQYSGNPWFVGVPLMQGGKCDAFLQDVADSLKGWEEAFPDVEAEIICEVSYW